MGFTIQEEKKVAQRIDEIGLQERASTMLAYRKESSEIIQMQRKFTSDLNGSWSSVWLNDEVGQLVTKNMVATTVSDAHHDSTFSVETDIRGKSADITVETLGTTSNTVSITVSGGRKSKTYVLTQTDVGVYEEQVPLENSGIYLMMITETDSSGTVVDFMETALAKSYSSEYDAFVEGGEELLNGLCSYSDGGMFQDISELVKVKMSSIRIIYNPMVLFAVLSLILLLADIAVRKLRWKDIKNYFVKCKKYLNRRMRKYRKWHKYK